MSCKEAVAALATLDVLQSLAAVATSPSYCRPLLIPDDAPPQLIIKGGRHPTLDLHLEGGAVPNDVNLCWGNERVSIITGPNMGGKSVFIRQAALIALMAQVRTTNSSDGFTHYLQNNMLQL